MPNPAWKQRANVHAKCLHAARQADRECGNAPTCKSSRPFGSSGNSPAAAKAYAQDNVHRAVNQHYSVIRALAKHIPAYAAGTRAPDFEMRTRRDTTLVNKEQNADCISWMFNIQSSLDGKLIVKVWSSALVNPDVQVIAPKKYALAPTPKLLTHFLMFWWHCIVKRALSNCIHMHV